MVVIDANIVMALILALPYSNRVATRIKVISEQSEEMYAPMLLEYEVCSALQREVSNRNLSKNAAAATIELVHGLGIQMISPTPSLHQAALAWAAKLHHSKTYDAQYLALAEQMHFPLLTADKRLARVAHTAGANWVECLI